MRKLLNTLFVLTAESYLTLDGENIVVNIDKKETARFPLHNFEAILCFSYTLLFCVAFCNIIFT